MITKIHIENFKGIGSPGIDIELKPITLLFGANSAGKSTVIQAIHYAREILARKNFNPVDTEYGGETIDLGGFENLVYGHDNNNEIVLEFHLDFKETDLPEYDKTFEYQLHKQSNANILGRLRKEIINGWIKITIAWNKKASKPISNYEVGLNGEKISTISLDESSVTASDYIISFLDYRHPLLCQNHEEAAMENQDIPDEVLEAGYEKEYINCELFEIYDLISSREVLRKNVDDVNITLNDQETAVPTWGRSLLIDENFFDNTNYKIKNEDGKTSIDEVKYYQDKNTFIQVLSLILVGTGEILTEELNKFIYVGPIRKIPNRNYVPKNYLDNTRWANGLGAWDYLFHSSHNFISKVSEWLSSENKLETGYSLEKKEYKKLYLDSVLYGKLLQGRTIDDDWLRNEIDNIETETQLYLIDDSSQIELLPYDIGIGVSQIIPVVVGALLPNKSILAIEQPELHMHPKVQVQLPDLFIEQINKINKGYFLIETHSEHIMLRFLRRIEETTEEELPNNNLRLVPEQLSVNFFEQNDLGTKITQLPIDESGEFTKQWPKGFFKERIEEYKR